MQVDLVEKYANRWLASLERRKFPLPYWYFWCMMVLSIIFVVDGYLRNQEWMFGLYALVSFSCACYFLICEACWRRITELKKKPKGSSNDPTGKVAKLWLKSLELRASPMSYRWTWPAFASSFIFFGLGMIASAKFPWFYLMAFLMLFFGYYSLISEACWRRITQLKHLLDEGQLSNPSTAFESNQRLCNGLMTFRNANNQPLRLLSSEDSFWVNAGRVLLSSALIHGIVFSVYILFIIRHDDIPVLILCALFVLLPSALVAVILAAFVCFGVKC
jgi:hypothetical protein